MDRRIKEIDLEGERVFLKKNPVLGWGIVHPYKIDGKWVLKNIIAGGSWIKMIISICFVIILILAIIEVSTIVQTANACLNDPIKIILP